MVGRFRILWVIAKQILFSDTLLVVTVNPETGHMTTAANNLPEDLVETVRKHFISMVVKYIYE